MKNISTIALAIASPLAVGLSAETFTLGRYGANCWDGDPNPWRNNVRGCTSDDSIADMVRTASVEITCRSDIMRFKAPMKLRYVPTDMVRTRHNGVLTDMPSSVSMDRFNLLVKSGEPFPPDHESRDTWLLNRFIDVWMGAAGNVDTDPGGTADCGNVPHYSIATSCGPIETSEGPILYPFHGVIAQRRRAEFDIKRDVLWDFLRQRGIDRERFDSNQSGESESPLLKMYLYDVINPNVPKMKDRTGYIKPTDTRHGEPASSWYMLGKVDWNGIEVTPTHRGMIGFGWWFDHTPSDLHDELNRLQDFYEVCEANSTAVELTSGVTSSAVSTARTAVRALQDDPEEWNRWKILTLEEFVDPPQ